MTDGLISRPFGQPMALFIGPQRAGTSWLDLYLRARGDICLPVDVKELFFFDRYFDLGADHYFSHFRPQQQHAMVAEITTTAFDHHEAPVRVRSLLGTDLRLICPLRNPVRRSFSLYLHYCRYGLVRGSLREACLSMPQIVTSSYYANHLQRWFDIFGRERVQILFQEMLEENAQTYVQQLCTALDRPYIPVPDDLHERVNATTRPRSAMLARLAQQGGDVLRRYRLYKLINLGKMMGLKNFIFGSDRRPVRDVRTRMTDEDRHFLEDRLGNEIEQLEGLLDLRLDLWRKYPIIP